MRDFLFPLFLYIFCLVYVMNNKKYNYYIYLIRNKINGKGYVGQHRISLRDVDLYRYMGKGIAITNAIKKYGKENFTKEILEYIEDDDKHLNTSKREIYWIKEKNTIYPNGYNLTPGGEGGCTRESALKGAKTRRDKGYKISEETKLKISNANKGVLKTESHKKHLSENHYKRNLKTIIFKNNEQLITDLTTLEIARKFNINYRELIFNSSIDKFSEGIKIKELKNIKFKQFKHLYYYCRDPITNELVKFSELSRKCKLHFKGYSGIHTRDYLTDIEIPLKDM